MQSKLVFNSNMPSISAGMWNGQDGGYIAFVGKNGNVVQLDVNKYSPYLKISFNGTVVKTYT